MNKITSFFTILVCAITCSACDFFSGGSASITVSLDADSLRKFVNENLSSQPVIKGHYEGEGADSLSLKVILSGDETGVWTSEILDIPNYRSNVSVKVDGLRVGAKIKVRVDLVKNLGMSNEQIIISGGTKSFRVSGGDNNVPIAMGNYSDIIVWRLVVGSSLNYYRGEIDSEFNDNFFSVSSSAAFAMTFDTANNSLHLAVGSDWYNVSWRNPALTANTADYCNNSGLSDFLSPIITARNGYLYRYAKSDDFEISGRPIERFKWEVDGRDELVFTFDSNKGGFNPDYSFRVDALTLSPDGKRAYLAYTVETDPAVSTYEYYIMSLDTSDDDEWKVISKIEIAPSGNFLGSGINAKDAAGFFYSDGFKITDMRVQEGYLWVLVREDKGNYSSYGISRGALMRYDLSLGSRKVFGWTSDKQGPRVASGYFRTPPSANSTNFFGPLKFIAVRPGELVIADDGVFIDNNDNNLDHIQRDRIIFFDIEKEAVSYIHDLDSDNYKFDGDYSGLSAFPD